MILSDGLRSWGLYILTSLNLCALGYISLKYRTRQRVFAKHLPAWQSIAAKGQSLIPRIALDPGQRTLVPWLPICLCLHCVSVPGACNTIWRVFLWRTFMETYGIGVCHRTQSKSSGATLAIVGRGDIIDGRKDLSKVWNWMRTPWRLTMGRCNRNASLCYILFVTGVVVQQNLPQLLSHLACFYTSEIFLRMSLNMLKVAQCCSMASSFPSRPIFVWRLEWQACIERFACARCGFRHLVGGGRLGVPNTTCQGTPS